MPNLYGVSNPVANPNFPSAASDVACTHDQWNVILSAGPFARTSAGIYYMNCICSVIVAIGAISVSGLNLGVSVNNGAVGLSIGWDYRTFVANTQYALCMPLVSVTSEAIWAPPGATVQIQLYPFAQNVTVRQNGTLALMQMVRASDQ